MRLTTAGVSSGLAGSPAMAAVSVTSTGLGCSTTGTSDIIEDGCCAGEVLEGDTGDEDEDNGLK